MRKNLFSLATVTFLFLLTFTMACDQKTPSSTSAAAVSSANPEEVTRLTTRFDDAVQAFAKPLPMWKFDAGQGSEVLTIARQQYNDFDYIRRELKNDGIKPSEIGAAKLSELAHDAALQFAKQAMTVALAGGKHMDPNEVLEFMDSAQLTMTNEGITPNEAIVEFKNDNVAAAIRQAAVALCKQYVIAHLHLLHTLPPEKENEDEAIATERQETVTFIGTVNRFKGTWGLQDAEIGIAPLNREFMNSVNLR